MRDLASAADSADGFIQLDAADYDAAEGIEDRSRALTWLYLRKQPPRRGPWSPDVEIQAYLRALGGE